jgi:hypothetical protein
VLCTGPSIAMERGALKTSSNSPSRHDSVSEPSSAKTQKREPLVTRSNSSLTVDDEATLEHPPLLQVPNPIAASPATGPSPFPSRPAKIKLLTFAG